MNTEIENNSGRFQTPPTFKHVSYDMIVKTSGEIQKMFCTAGSTACTRHREETLSEN